MTARKTGVVRDGIRFAPIESITHGGPCVEGVRRVFRLDVPAGRSHRHSRAGVGASGRSARA